MSSTPKPGGPPDPASQGGPARVQQGSLRPPTGASPEANASPGLLALLKLEAEARDAGTFDELQFLVASETRKLTRSRQVFVFGRVRTGDLQIKVISGLPAVDRSAPLVQAIEGIVAKLRQDQDLAKAREFDINAYGGTYSEFTSGYPFSALVWLPFLDRQRAVIGGMLLAREQPWSESDIVVGRRLSETFAHALRELSGQPPLYRSFLPGRRTAALALLLSGALLFLPVSMTTLAPFEIGPENGFVVAAPIEGIIEDIAVEPSASVVDGQTLVRMTDTMLKNRLGIAEREVQVADARLKTSTQMAFADAKGRHELGLAMSEVELKTAERDYARDMLARSVVRAPKSGIAVFSDKKQLIGRPVAIGERIMEIADPSHVEALVDVPVGDAIVLKAGARVKLFLDAEPLKPRDAIIRAADYQARVRPGNVVSFRVVAGIEDGKAPLRLGARGTAQLYGDKVSLGFYMFRRPLTVLRQWTGL